MNDIFFNRVFKLIGMNFAISEQEVKEIYEKLGSIDKTIESLQNNKNMSEQYR